MRPGRAILFGALTVGLLDGLDAIIFFGLRNGFHPQRLFQGIASGLIGRASFEGGIATMLLGILCHFTVATGIVTTYHFASRRLPTLAERPFVWGPLYGIAVYFTMNLVVIPLSAITTRGFSPPLPVLVNGLLIHILGVGIPSAWFARAARQGLPPA